MAASPSGVPAPVLCLHEEIAVAVAHGYARATGRPMAVLVHDLVGLQHATLAIFNAWCDRVPMLILGGTGPLSRERRRHWIDWIHTSASQGELIREYVKWEDQPHDLESIVPSFERAWQVATAAPTGPVYLCFDVELQEQGVGDAALTLPEGLVESTPTPPGLDATALEWLRDRLVSARLPVLVADYAAVTPEAFAALQELAANLEAPVIDCGARLNFPTDDRLNFTGLSSVLDEADLVVGFEIEDRYSQVVDRLAKTEVVHVSLGHMRVRSWAEDALRLLPASRTLSAASEAVLPALARAVAERPSSPDVLAARRSVLDGRVAAARWAWAEEARSAEAADGRIPMSRVAWELWEAIRGEPFALVGGFLGDWERRLWSFDAERPHLGGQAGGGLGFVAGSAVGATLALRGSHLCLAVLPDGDLLYAPGALWTAARAELPLLMVTNNNRAYQNTFNHASQLAAARERAPDPPRHENVIDEPPVDLAALARSFGVWATGPVSKPADLQPALREALEIVRSGKPALVDVLTL